MNPDKRRARASRLGHPVRDRRHGSRVRPGRSVAGTGAQIDRVETRRRPRRLPIRNPIRTGAGGAEGVVEGAAHGPAGLRIPVGRPILAMAQVRADVRAAEFAGIEWTSGALA